ncbi:MAG: PIN domain-containing protein [Hyphomicrobiaceae bacterium]|nr:PIN domain-containing protein [Hyphomicrobiaceae bacterium]
MWLALFRVATQSAKDKLADAVANEPIVFAPFVITELLKGAKNEIEWDALSGEISKFGILQIEHETWSKAARIFYDLQRSSVTVRSSVDCLIAQPCIENFATLIHNDRDFDRITTVRPLNHLRLDLSV